MSDTEELLSGGERFVVTRLGDTIYRPGEAWSATVHALLRHLENLQFHASPRVVGTGFDDRGREMLTYLEGSFVHPRCWSDEAFPVLGRMLRDLHDATASFVVSENAIWKKWFGRELGEGKRVIGHCDTGPWNIVARDGLPIGLIDWEFAGPADLTYQLAQACWLNAQLVDDDIAERQGLPAAEHRVKQMRWLLDGYEANAELRKGLGDKLIAFVTYAAAAEVIEARVTPETVDSTPLWAIAWRSRSAAWLLRNRSMIENALV